MDAGASVVLLINGEAYTEDSLTITEPAGTTTRVQAATILMGFDQNLVQK